MRSLIKSHKRDVSGSSHTDQLLPSDFDFESPFLEDAHQYYSPNSPTTLNKSKKLQRLFQRSSRHASPKINSYSSGLSPVSPKKNTSPPSISIIGTRTHEWGSSPNKNTNRISTNSINSIISSTSELNLNTGNTPKRYSQEEGDLIQLPLNTVLEIPNKEVLASPNQIKSVHRRAQIVTTDSPQLDDAAEVFRDFNKFETPEQASNYSYEEQEEEEEEEGSEFSFEQNNITGRNSSIRYYKSEQEVSAAKEAEIQPGFYINDFVDEDFDDDLNYFDEDDDFNDDEELFNRKYFDDDDSPDRKPTVTLEKKKPVVQPSRSLKYHQLPNVLDQEFSTKRYSWFSDDEDQYQRQDVFRSRPNSFDEDAFLDEINNIPENYEFDSGIEDHATAKLPKSKSLKSSLRKGKKAIVQNSQQNNKIITNSKTVTLFNNSSRKPTEQSTFGGYSTPNSSFTTPNPQFVSDQGNLDLSPISEGHSSFDESP